MNNPNQPQPLVSPTAYIHRSFGEWCEENMSNPQEILMMLIFRFLQINPEQRVNEVRHMKADFTKFAGTADFDGLQKIIDDGVNQVELALLDYLEEGWETQETEI